MTVRQEKNKKKWTKDGRSWYYDVYYTDMYGNRKEKKSMYYKNKTIAKDAQLNFLNKIKQNGTTNIYISGNQLLDEWLTYKKNTVKSTTYANIENFANKYFRDFFGKYKDIHNIKVTNLEQWKFELKQRKDSKIEHKNRIIGYLREILKYGVDNYDYDSKILTKVLPFSNEHSAQKINDSEWNYLTPEEWKKFISSVDDPFYYLVFSFLYLTGVRIGELTGLVWKNVDLDNSRFRVIQQLTTKTKSKKAEIIDPKTKKSIRVVDMPNQLSTLLKKHYEEEKKIINFSEEWFVFGNVKYISQTTLRRRLEYYLKKSGTKHITIHGFRHSHASLLIHLGCDSRDVANRIGDTVEMVERVYYHMFPKKEQKTVELLNKI